MIEALQQRAHHSFQITWGDAGTWALVVAAGAAFLLTLRQLRVQQQDSARATRQTERQQANKVDFAWCQADSVLFLTNPVSQFPRSGRAVAVVSNNSPRPIRAVTSQIKHPDGTTLEPTMLGVVTEDAPDSPRTYTMYGPRPGAQVPLVRPGFKYGFVFEFTIPDDDAAHPERRSYHPFAQFTDDADLHWQVDDTLRLRQLPRPRPPHPSWRGTMGPSDPLRR